jgi:parallel beta-helix repeat protein
VPDSPYLPVTLDSTVSVTLTLSSVPDIVDLTIAADASAGSAVFTVNGFTANTLYYHYSDNGLNPVTFTTDAAGSFTYTQDLAQSHHVWFRDRPNTYHIDATGGDCAAFGTWTLATKTCTLTTDVYQSIFIEANGITLDGNGFASLFSDDYYAVYSYGYSDVTIKNLNVSGSSYGILAAYGANLTVTHNNVTGGYYGIITDNDSNQSVTNNTVTNPRYYGIFNIDSSNVTIDQNTVSGGVFERYCGICSYGSGVAAITNNTITGYIYGIQTYYPDNLTMANNTISNANYGLYLYYFNSYNVHASVYNNNFINNLIQIYQDGSGTSFNQAAPVGGNFFSDFHTPGQGCVDTTPSDGFCDTAYAFSGGQDNLPWTTQNGWVSPADSTPPVITYTLTPSTSDGANGWYKSNVDLVWSVTDPESTVTKTGCDDQNITADQAATVYSCSATSAGGAAGPVNVSIQRDATLPMVSLIDGPANGGSYYFGSVPAAPTCLASDALSGLDGSCTVSGYGTTVGSQTVAATAKDMAGNQNGASAAYTVLAWTLNGFYQPTDMSGMWNTVKNGSTVPLKFEVFAGSTELISTAIVNQPLKATQTPCSGGTIDDIELLATGATSLRYDATGGQFIYNWQTPKKPGYCYVVTVTLTDGTSMSANFKLK